MKRLRLIVLVLAFTGAWVPASPAQAADVDLVCTVTIVGNFDPPLLPGGQSTLTAHGPLLNCISPNGKWPNLHNAGYSTVAPGSATAVSGVNPCSLVLTVSARIELQWQDGSRTRGLATGTTDPSNGTIGFSVYYDRPGDPLYGTTATVAPVVANPNPDCATVGLTTLTTDLGLYLVD